MTERASSTPRHVRSVRKAALLGAGLALFAALGCSSKDEPSSLGSTTGTGGFTSSDGGSPQTCVDGTVRSCIETVGLQGSVLTCFEGQQTCEGTVWGPCIDGQFETRILPGGPLPTHTMSLSDAGSCANNPCDPTCQVFDEDPDGGVSLEPTQDGPDWWVGNSGDLANTNWPGGQFAKGMKYPCYDGQDCQFDQYCQSPHTQATCSHSKCSTGRGLASTCEACVTRVCAERPSCCNTSSTTAWDSQCVDLVGKVCNSRCPTTGTCEHSMCLPGNRLSATCDTCVSSVCALRPTCCTGSWDSHCVAMVGSVCNANCAAGTGQCVAYNPSETNPYCVGLPDLTAGVPCGNTVPICNRGDTAVLANTAKFWVYPASSSHWQECSPDLSNGQWPKACPIADRIEPGTCVSVSCTHLDQLKTVVVNPWSDPDRIDECSCQNNWSLYKKETGNNTMTCSAPVCASSTVEASIATVNMFITFDKSGSMCEPQAQYGCANPGPTTRWGLTTNALKSFIRDPKSAGMRVALRFFPGYDSASNTVCGGYCYGWGTDCFTTCNTGQCATPHLDLGPLLSAQVADPPPNNCNNSGDSQECNLVKIINANYPNGGTPISEALTGATSRMGNYLATGDNYLERAVVVLFTDGEATWCNTNPTTIASIADNAYKNWGVVTYTVGLADASQALLTDIADKGRGEAYFLSTTNTATDLVNALNAIRNKSVSCDLTLDTTNGINVDDVKLAYTSGTNTTQFTRVMAESNCGTLTNRWYFDNNTAPTKITLCPETCAIVRGDPAAKLSLEIGCPLEFEPATITHVYSASCAPGQAAQWNYLTWDSVTPATSFIQFSARTSNDITEFATEPSAGTMKELGVAHAEVAPYTSDTQSCQLSGNLSADCPVDMYQKLGTPAAHRNHLELRIALYPATTGSTLPPTLSSWNVSYSCIASE